MDVWDASALVGLGLVVGGVAMVSVPAALVLTGSAMLGVYYLRERSHGVPQPPVERE